MQYVDVRTKEITNLESTVEVYPADTAIFLTTTPHSGGFIPECLTADYDMHNGFLEDPEFDTDQIYDLRESGGTLVKQLLHMLVLDSNRKRSEDGFFPDNATNGQAVLKSELSAKCKGHLTSFFQQYLQTLKNLMYDLRNKYGTALLLNGHSMFDKPPNSRHGIEYKERPDICIGTNNGQSIGPNLLECVVENLRVGYHLETGNEPVLQVNKPFQGTKGITTIFGNQNRNMNCVLVELNRRLYIDGVKHNQEEIYTLNQALAYAFGEVGKEIVKH